MSEFLKMLQANLKNAEIKKIYNKKESERLKMQAIENKKTQLDAVSSICTPIIRDELIKCTQIGDRQCWISMNKLPLPFKNSSRSSHHDEVWKNLQTEGHILHGMKYGTQGNKIIITIPFDECKCQQYNEKKKD